MRELKGIILIVLLFSFSLSNLIAQEKHKTHSVKSGETVRSIALKYNITPYDLIKINPDVEDPPLVGSTLIIPNTDDTTGIVDKAKPRKVSGSDANKVIGGYIYHTVKPKETIFSLAKLYNVEIKDLYESNPVLIDGLKIDMILSVPRSMVKVEQVKRDTSKYIFHVIEPKETRWGLCHKYSITEEQLLESNPIVGQKLNIGDTLWIPKNEVKEISEVENINFNYTYYEVKAKETVYGISRKFEISIDELNEENPIIKTEGLNIGMVLKIPKSPREIYDTSKYVLQTYTNLPNDSLLSSVEKIEELDKLNFPKVVDVVLMLPFYMGKNAELIGDKIPVKKNELKKQDDPELVEPSIFSRSAIALEFYNGALFAIDSLKNMGLSVRLRVFDTENNLKVVKKIMDNNDFSEVDVVIGPLYTDNVEYVADRLKYDNILVISPLSKKLNIDNRFNLVQAMPTSFTTKNTVLKEIIKEQTDSSNIVVFGGLIDKVEVDFVESRLKSEIDSNRISTYIAEENLVDREIVFEMLEPNNDNIIVIASKDDVLVTDVITALNQVTDSLPNRAYLLSRPRVLDQLESDYLNSVSLAYPEDFFIDKQNSKVKKFNKEFRLKNKYIPGKYSYRGFDITYDVLLSIGNSSNLEVGILQNNKTCVQGKFNYIRKPFGGYYNNGVFIIRYNNWNLEVVNE